MTDSQKLYILPFDHRESFAKTFGLNAWNLSPEDIEKISDYKHIVYEGFLAALNMGVPKEAAAILVDEQFGSQIHKEAEEIGIKRILTVEKSGQSEFDFEYGDAFGEHIEKLKPDYVKVLVRYNLQGDKELNKRQIEKLKIINDFCRRGNYKFLFELLTSPTPEQLEKLNGDKELYDKNVRGNIMAESIRELQAGGIEPDVWKVEGLENAEQMLKVVGQIQSGGREKAKVVVLGRGEDEDKVKKWLKVAAKIHSVIGFAVGRTVFVKPLMSYHQGETNREETAAMIAKNYKNFVDLFESRYKRKL